MAGTLTHMTTRRWTVVLGVALAAMGMTALGAAPDNQPAAATHFAWTGMRSPCKVSAEDGLNQKQLGKKIGRFMAIDDPAAWANAIGAVHSRYPGSKAWVTWTVGPMRDATTQPDAVHEACLSRFDELGVVVFLELAPINKNTDVPGDIDVWLGKFKSHRAIAGVSVDLEYFKKVDDATAKAWDEQIKKIDPSYRLMLKHWEQAYMPPTYRGNGVIAAGSARGGANGASSGGASAAGDMIFVCTSSEESVDALNVAFTEWAEHFSPSAVAFQFGYPADEDGMDGTAKTGWWKLDDPIKSWGDDLLARLKNPNQQLGLIWVCAKSGKTYNAKWDLTKAK